MRNQGSPSQDPRDHMAQAVKGITTHIGHFEANNEKAVSQREWFKER